MAEVVKRISLEGVKIFAYHGYFPEEQIIGTPFSVDVFTEMESRYDESDDLELTVDYGRLFEIVSEEMKITRKLLEKVAHAILSRIKDEFPAVSKITVSISKLSLPIKGEVRNSKVELAYVR
jgi:dihydroneopterin aldolase